MVISFITANYVAEHTGWAMHGWGHGDRTTNERFAPLETYAERLDELLGRIRRLGFDAIDLWGAHLSPDWATDEHVEIAQQELERHEQVLRVLAPRRQGAVRDRVRRHRDGQVALVEDRGGAAELR